MSSELICPLGGNDWAIQCDCFFSVLHRTQYIHMCTQMCMHKYLYFSCVLIQLHLLFYRKRPWWWLDNWLAHSKRSIFIHQTQYTCVKIYCDLDVGDNTNLDVHWHWRWNSRFCSLFLIEWGRRYCAAVHRLRSYWMPRPPPCCTTLLYSWTWSCTSSSTAPLPNATLKLRMKAKMHQQCTSEECPKECTSKCPIAPSLNRLRWLAPTFLPPTDERCTQSNDALHYNCHNAPTLQCIVSAHTEEKSTALCYNNAHCTRTCTRTCTCTCTRTCDCTCTMHNALAHCTCPYLAPTPTLNCATKRGELTNVWWVMAEPVRVPVYHRTIVPVYQRTKALCGSTKEGAPCHSMCGGWWPAGKLPKRSGSHPKAQKLNYNDGRKGAVMLKIVWR